VDPGSAPQRVLPTPSSDQVAHLFADPWPATARTRHPSPVRGKARSMPTQPALPMLGATMLCQISLERVPIKWNHLIDKESLNINKLENVLIEKVEQLFRDLL
jgi:hypothetical protein